MRIGHIIWKGSIDGSSDFGEIINLKYPQKYDKCDPVDYDGEFDAEVDCPKRKKKWEDVTEEADILRYLADERYEISDTYLSDNVMRSLPGHIYDMCNPDPCPSDSTVDNLLETLNGILTDAGNPNLKLCPA